MPEKVFYARNTDLAPLKDGQARAIDIFGAQLPDRSALVLKADADRLAAALLACKIRVPIYMDLPYEDGNLDAYNEAKAALAAYNGETDD